MPIRPLTACQHVTRTRLLPRIIVPSRKRARLGYCTRVLVGFRTLYTDLDKCKLLFVIFTG